MRNILLQMIYNEKESFSRNILIQFQICFVEFYKTKFVIEIITL